VVAGLIASRAMVEEEIEKTKSILQARGDEVAALLDAFHRSYQTPVRRLATLPEIIRYVQADEATRPILEEAVQVHFVRWQKSEPSFRGLGILDRSGKVLMMKGTVSLPPDLAGRAYLKKGLAGRGVISEVRLDPEADFRPGGKVSWKDLESYKPTISYLYPVGGDDGKVAGLVGLWVDAAAMWAILKQQHEKAGPGSYISLFDQTGVRIGHSFNPTLPFYAGGDVDADSVRTMVAEHRLGRHTAQFFEKKNIKYFDAQFREARAAEPTGEIFRGFARANYKWNIGTARRLKTADAPWTLFFMIPQENIDAPLSAISWRVLFISGGLIFLALVVGFVFARTILRPIRALGNALGEFGAGDLHARVASPGADEIGRLGAGFNQMADRLQSTVNSLHEREARIHAIMDTVADGISTVTEHGIIDSVNTAAAAMFGYRPQELAGQPLAMLLTQPLSPGSEGEKGVEMEGTRKDGSKVPVEVAIGKTQIGERRLLTVSFHDLTEWKRAQQELLQAKEKAENAIVARDLFLAQVSHELRTPLNHILGFCQLLELGAVSESQQRDLDKIHQAGDHLRSLIEDILDYQKIVMGQVPLEWETFDSGVFVRELAESMEGQVRQKGNRLQIRCESDVAVCCDRKRLQQILANLLSNAAKFTTKGLISVWARREQAQRRPWLVVSVTDTGCGISADNLDKLFKPFGQLSDKRDNPEGTGLGLAISKMLCERLGGEIMVTSTVGQGSTFSVRLPVAPVKRTGLRLAAEPPAAGPVMPRSLSTSRRKTVVLPLLRPGRPCTVLAIDDDPQVGEMMRRFLEHQGFDIHVAATGIQALEMVKNLRPDVITLDVLMPGIDGWGVLAALRNDADTAAIPVIVLSIVDERSKGFLLGANEYVTKPVDWEQLATLLRKYKTPAEATTAGGGNCAAAHSSRAAGKSSRPKTAPVPCAASASAGPASSFWT
jgi:PAS domain S-box-containing protein